jgi:hypothetical protein
MQQLRDSEKGWKRHEVIFLARQASSTDIFGYFHTSQGFIKSTVRSDPSLEDRVIVCETCAQFFRLDRCGAGCMFLWIVRWARWCLFLGKPFWGLRLADFCRICINDMIQRQSLGDRVWSNGNNRALGLGNAQRGFARVLRGLMGFSKV